MDAIATVMTRLFLQYVWRLPSRRSDGGRAFALRRQRVEIRAEDGVKLVGELISPIGLEGPRPAILVRTPYSRWLCRALLDRLAERGAHVLLCDCRGRFRSGGSFELLKDEKRDSLACLRWLARSDNRAWFNGDLGLFGVSYDGFTLWSTLAAYLEAPPPGIRVRAVVPIFTATDIGRRGMYSGGVFQLELAARYLHLTHRLESPSTLFGSRALWVYLELFRVFRLQKGAWWSRALNTLPLRDLSRALLGDAAVGETGDRYEIRSPNDSKYWSERSHTHVLQMLAKLYILEEESGGGRVGGQDAGREIKKAGGLGAQRRQYPYLPHILLCVGFYDLFADAQFADLEALKGGRSTLPRKVRLVACPMRHFDEQQAFVRRAFAHFDKHLIRPPDGDAKTQPKGQSHEPPVEIFPIGSGCDAGPYCGLGGIGIGLRRALLRRLPAYDADHWAHPTSPHWRQFNTWPPPLARPTPLWLDDQGALNWASGGGSFPRENKYVFRYDPEDPTPSLGGNIFHPRKAGRVDNSRLEQRPDVLVFTSPPLKRDSEIAGTVQAELYVEAGTASFDVFVRLCEVDRRGSSYNITDGIMRVNTCQGSSAGPRRVGIDMAPVAAVFSRGNRIRLQVSGGAFPRFSRNLGTTGLPDAEQTRLVRGGWNVTIFTGGMRASRLSLPLIMSSKTASSPPGSMVWRGRL